MAHDGRRDEPVDPTQPGEGRPGSAGSGETHRQLYALAREGYLAGGGFFSSIMSGFLIGFVLDWWLGTRPWFIVAGIVLGSISGFLMMHSWAVQEEQRRER